MSFLGRLEPSNPEIKPSTLPLSQDSQNFTVSSADEISVKEKSTKYIQ